MARYFSISGYWKDDKSEFSDYIVKDTNDIIDIEDENIFFYGLSENEIKEAIELGENTANDFVILSYKECDPLTPKPHTKVILEFYMEMWYCYEDGESMAYPLFTKTSYDEISKVCDDFELDVIQIIDPNEMD